MEIKLDKYTLRFDPSEIRISIDGEKIDVGARTKEEKVHCYPVSEPDKIVDVGSYFVNMRTGTRFLKNEKDIKPDDDILQIALDNGYITLEQAEEIITARGLRSGRNSNTK